MLVFLYRAICFPLTLMLCTFAFDINEMTQDVLKVATNQLNENVCLQENVPYPQKYDTWIATPLLHHESTPRAICSIHSFCGTLWLGFLIFLILNHFCALHAWRTQRRWIRKPILSYQERITGLMADWKDILHGFSIILTAVFSLLAVCTTVLRARRFCLPSFYIVEFSFFISFSNSVLFVSQVWFYQGCPLSRSQTSGQGTHFWTNWTTTGIAISWCLFNYGVKILAGLAIEKFTTDSGKPRQVLLSFIFKSSISSSIQWHINRSVRSWVQVTRTFLCAGHVKTACSMDVMRS